MSYRQEFLLKLTMVRPARTMFSRAGVERKVVQERKIETPRCLYQMPYYLYFHLSIDQRLIHVMHHLIIFCNEKNLSGHSPGLFSVL
jgi:hypothetical protein